MSQRMNHDRVNLQKRISREVYTAEINNGPIFPDHDWLKLWFGKYRGKTLPEILLVDPTYVIEYLEHEARKRLSKPDLSTTDYRLVYQLEVLGSRAQNIIVPADKRSTHDFAIWRAKDGSFAGARLARLDKEIVSADTDKQLHTRTPKLTFQIAKAFKYYGKGLIAMAESVDHLISGSTKRYATGEEIREFFSDKRNFDLDKSDPFRSLFMTAADVSALKEEYLDE